MTWCPLWSIVYQHGSLQILEMGNLFTGIHKVMNNLPCLACHELYFH
jgi:hypothetical protein